LKQLRCPLIGEWINCDTFIQWILYSVLKRNEPWTDMKETLMHIDMLKKPVWKTTCCMIPMIWQSGKGKTTEIVESQRLPGILGKEGGMNKWSTGDF